MDHIDKAVARETEIRDDALAALKRAQLEQRSRPSLRECAECGDAIPQKRQLMVPGVRLCVICQTKFEKRKKGYAA